MPFETICGNNKDAGKGERRLWDARPDEHGDEKEDSFSI